MPHGHLSRARAEKKGKVLTQEAQGTSTNSIANTQRSMLLTKCSWVERT
jgi:hypothetical protein